MLSIRPSSALRLVASSTSLLRPAAVSTSVLRAYTSYTGGFKRKRDLPFNTVRGLSWHRFGRTSFIQLLPLLLLPL
jgi:hypothetical protein